MTSQAIETFAVEHDFGSEPVLQGLSMRVPRGSVYGLLGRNGSGKTTLIRMLLDLLRPRAGRCEVLGIDPTRDGLAVRARVGYMPQESDFDSRMLAGSLPTIEASASNQTGEQPIVGEPPGTVPGRQER